MSHAGVFRPLAAAVFVASLVSLVSCAQGISQADFDAVAPSVDSVHINFKCVAGDTIALVDKSGHAAWTFRRKPGDPVTWIVPNNVAIHSIGGKSPGDFPVDSAGVQGGPAGAPFKAKVKNGAAWGTYHYLITATCNPGQSDSLRLVIDPEMIVRKP